MAEKEQEKLKEKVRRTTGAEMQLIKEKLAEQEMAKMIQIRKKEKIEEKEARERVRKQLQQDKLERQNSLNPPKPLPQEIKPVVESSHKNFDQTRIQVRLPNGQSLSFALDSLKKLKDVYDFVEQQYPHKFHLVQTFPRKVFNDAFFDKTLQELNMVPSVSLMVQNL